MQQPVPKVSRSDVERILARDFEPQAREGLRKLLAGAGATLSPRVLLAVLKLADGDAEAVAARLEAARSDWRDVVAEAEYPRYTEATTGGARPTPERRDELVRADWEHYRDWLER